MNLFKKKDVRESKEEVLLKDPFYLELEELNRRRKKLNYWNYHPFPQYWSSNTDPIVLTRIPTTLGERLINIMALSAYNLEKVITFRYFEDYSNNTVFIITVNEAGAVSVESETLDAKSIYDAYNEVKNFINNAYSTYENEEMEKKRAKEELNERRKVLTVDFMRLRNND